MSRLYLNEWIEAIRLDLQAGVTRASGRDPADHPLRFAIQEVTIEVSVESERDTEGSGGIKFWVVEAGAKASERKNEIQKLAITLRAATDTYLGDEPDLLAKP